MLRGLWLLAMLDSWRGSVLAGCAADRRAGKDAAKRRGGGWQAVAPGVVEPGSGQIKIAAPVIGRVSEVMVKSTIKSWPTSRFFASTTKMPRRAWRRRRPRSRCAKRRVMKSLPARRITAATPRTPWPMPRRTRGGAQHVRGRPRQASGSGSDATVTAARTAWTRAQDNLERERSQLRKSRPNPERRCRHSWKGNSMSPGTNFGSRSQSLKN